MLRMLSAAGLEICWALATNPGDRFCAHITPTAQRERRAHKWQLGAKCPSRSGLDLGADAGYEAVNGRHNCAHDSPRPALDG
jgi:hypothetical protein